MMNTMEMIENSGV